MWCWGRTGRISRTDRVKNEEVLQEAYLEKEHLTNSKTKKG